MSDLTTRIVKIPARQAGPYGTGSNRINVTIPSNMICDLSKSFLEAEININTTGGTGVYNVNLQYGGNKDDPVYNVALFKNCRLSSDQLGNIEETQDVNHLRTNLNHLQMSRSEQLSLSYNSLRQLTNRYGQKCGIFRQLNGEGTVPSVQQLGRVPVPLSQLFGMGDIDEVDTSVTGELNIEVELDFNISSALMDDNTQYPCNGAGGADNIVLTGATTARNFPFSIGQGVFFLKDSGGDRIGFRTITDINQGTNTITFNAALPGTLTNITVQKADWRGAADMNDSATVVLNGVYENLNDSPFWVGQRVETSGTVGAADVDTANIISIERSSAGVVTIILDSPTTGGAITDVIIRPYLEGVSSQLSFESINLVLHEKMEASVDHSGGYRIYSYQTEKSNGNSNQIYNGSFNLPPRCINAVLMNKVANQLYSQNNDVTDYRLVLDNNNLTDRPVVVEESLYYDELGKWCLNSGQVLKNLQAVPQTENYNLKHEGAPGMHVVYIGTHTPQTAQPKILQIEANTTANGLGNINMYKQLELVVGGK